MKLTLPGVALIAFVATTAFTATSANAVQFRSYRCDIDFFGGCGHRLRSRHPHGPLSLASTATRPRPT